MTSPLSLSLGLNSQSPVLRGVTQHTLTGGNDGAGNFGYQNAEFGTLDPNTAGGWLIESVRGNPTSDICFCRVAGGAHPGNVQRINMRAKDDSTPKHSYDFHWNDATNQYEITDPRRAPELADWFESSDGVARPVRFKYY